MTLQFEINPLTLNRQIEIVSGMMRLPKLQPAQKHSLAELLKMLYALKRELLEEELVNGGCIRLSEFLETENWK